MYDMYFVHQRRRLLIKTSEREVVNYHGLTGHRVIVGTRDLKYLQFESDPVDSM